MSYEIPRIPRIAPIARIALAEFVSGTLIVASPVVALAESGRFEASWGGGEPGFLGIYADPEGTQPCATIHAGTVGNLYVVATAPQGGFTGAEFSIQVTNPEGYILLYVPPEGAIVFGDPLDRTPNDPLDGSGVNIAWSTCRTSARVAMGSIIVFNQSGGPTELQIKRRNRPANPFIGWCPLFVACNAPELRPDVHARVRHRRDGWGNRGTFGAQSSGVCTRSVRH
jgi:hypothetical protein